MAETIIVAFKDVGGANAVLPVAAKLRSFGHTVVLYADGVSYDRFKERERLVSSMEVTPEFLLETYNPKLVVTTCCSPGGVVPGKLAKSAQDQGILVVGVQDFWGNHAKGQWLQQPNTMCVQDEFARDLVLKTWSGERYKDDVVVTGQPAFDRLANVDTNTAEKKLREELGITNGRPIVYFSGQTRGMGEAAEMLVDGMNLSGRPMYLLYRPHPRLLKPDDPSKVEVCAKIQERCAAAFAKLGSHVIFLNAPAISSPDLANQGAQVTVAMYSTTLVEGCYIRRPGICLWGDFARENLLMETAGTLDDFPPAALEACMRAKISQEVAVYLEGIFSGEGPGASVVHIAARNQALHYGTRCGGATDRVVEVVEGYLSR